MTTYSYEDALSKSIDYFGGEDLPAKVFLDKYALRDGEGNLLEATPTQMHKRLAKEFARVELKYDNPMLEDEIFNLMDNFKYIIPQGSPMSAIGNPYHIQSSGNCFSIEPPYDSYGGICYTDQQLVQLMKRRCGVGLNLSTLRPKGQIVKNAAKTTDGIEIFMNRFSNTCREVAQKGRRGAEILLLNVHHPEVETFINSKRDKTKITGANISIQATDNFLTAAFNDEEYKQQWPIDAKNPTINYMTSAKKIWDSFIDSSWESAEPGILFWDTVLKNSVSNNYGAIDKTFYDTACNPCGEIVMGADSCRLLAINIYSFVENKFKSNATFNYEKFSEVVQKAQRMMDDMVDLEIELIERILTKVESDPEPEHIKEVEKQTWVKILETCKKGRRTGLGITGLGDTIAALNQRYGSDKSIKTTEKIYKNLCLNAYRSTCNLAKERGSFPIFSHKIEKDNLFLSKIWEEDPELYKIYKKHGRRNIALTTTPPAGSISILAQVTSGIEPVFMVEYKRRKKINSDDENNRVDFIDESGDSWQEFDIYHKGFKEWMEISGEKDIKKSPYFNATTKDIDWISSVDIQAVAQKWVCHSISKTCVIKETLIETKKGLFYMDELFELEHLSDNESKKSKEDIFIKNKNNKWAKVNKYFKKGKFPVFKLMCDNGLNVTATANERIFVLNEKTGIDEWKYLREIKEGDRVSIL